MVATEGGVTQESLTVDLDNLYREESITDLGRGDHSSARANQTGWQRRPIAGRGGSSATPR